MWNLIIHYRNDKMRITIINYNTAVHKTCEQSHCNTEFLNVYMQSKTINLFRC